jgi:PAS domain S-box-containing protein
MAEIEKTSARGVVERMLNEKESYHRLLDHFNLLGEMVASSSHIEEILEQIAQSASEILGANPVILFQYDHNLSQLIPPLKYAGQLSDKDDYVMTFTFTGNTFAEKIVTGGESLYFETPVEIIQHPFMASEEPESIAGRPRIRFHIREGIASMAALVLKAGGEIVGLMFLNYRAHQTFDDSVKKLMKTFASYAAIAIRNSRLIQQLRRNDAFQRRIVDKMPDPVFVTRNKKEDGKLVWRIEVANRAAHKLLGYDYKLKECEGKDARELLTLDLDKLRKALREGDGEVSNCEVSILNKNGESVPISISTASLERDEAQHVTRTICIAKDLTIAKQLEKQLEHLNRAMFVLLNTESLDQAYDAIFENLAQIGFDKGMISLVDETARTIVGKRATGRNWRDLQNKTNVALDSNDILARVVRSGTAEFIEDCEKNPYCDQEMIRRVGIKSQYIIPLIVQDKVIGALQIGFSEREDLLTGDRYYLKETLKILLGFANQVAVAIESNRQKIHIERLETTMADIGHEFRSPLHNLSTQLGGLEYYLKKKYGDDERVRKVARIVQEEAFRADRQMKNALFSTGESFEQRGTNFEEGLISDVIIFCAERFQETAQKRGINIIIYDSLKKLPAVHFDKSQIEQVFTNLIDNAVKYSYGGESVEVKGQDHGRKVEISIKDNGVGIPERLYEKIFEGFTRSDILDAARFIPGTGLGLKIARKIVLNHKGKIFVHSKAYYNDPKKVANYEGYTTTFVAILPKNPKEL